MKTLTLRQTQVFDFICASVKENGFPPTRIEIQVYFGFASQNSAQLHIETLERKGYLRITKDRARGISITPAAQNTLATPQSITERYWVLLEQDLNVMGKQMSIEAAKHMKSLLSQWLLNKIESNV